MTDKRSFYERLLKVQTELKAPKGQENKFGGYRYRSCEDILEAAKPLLAKHGLTINLTDEIELVGERYYVKATAIVRDTLSDTWTFATAYARETEDKKGMDAAQVTGSASSYARKYALNGLLLIDDTKDDDTREPTDKPKGAKPKNDAKVRLWTAMKAYCERHGVTQESELELLGGKDFVGKQSSKWMNDRAEYYEAN